MSRGPHLFARFALPPNRLGYCGTAHTEELVGAWKEGDDRSLRLLSESFSGAFPYLQLIAASNGIEDPTDARVVDAYWIGNALLDRVTVSDFAGHLADRFRLRAGSDWKTIAGAALSGGVPSHAFHVFATYPWVGLMRAGKSSPSLEVLDQCRVTPARVISVSESTAQVLVTPLEWDGQVISTGAEELRTVTCDRDMVSPKPESLVALHWNSICGELTPSGADRLRRYTANALSATRLSPAEDPGRH